MHKSLFLLGVGFLILSGFGFKENAIKFHKIKEQKLNCYDLLGDEEKYKLEAIKGFEISDFISYGNYKIYLNAIQKDSSTSFYVSQLPDSTMCFKKEYDIYLNSTEYDLFPVVGVSWDAAMNFCKWKTKQDNKNGKLSFIYSLPTAEEWLAATKLKGNKIDINSNYSDWILTTKDESVFYYSAEFNVPFYSYIYFHKQDDPPVLKRKIAIGNSFLFKQKKLKNFFTYSYYSNHGYKHIAFRIVKKDIKENNSTLINSILNFWGL